MARRLVMPWVLRRKVWKINGRRLDLRKCETYCDRLQWLKVHGGLERYAPLVDKNAVRDYVAAVVGERYLVPRLGVYQSAEELPWADLPSRFVVKASHGSGWVVAVEDKDKVDIAALTLRMNGWLAQSYFDVMLEPCYIGIPPRLVVEEHLGLEGTSFRDYKIFCFEGRPEIVHVDIDLLGDRRRAYYTPDWKRLAMRCRFPPPDVELERPKQINELLALAGRLSAPFPSVRVDLYLAQHRLLFGELTFLDGSGYFPFQPEEAELRYGRLLPMRRGPEAPFWPELAKGRAAGLGATTRVNDE